MTNFPLRKPLMKYDGLFPVLTSVCDTVRNPFYYGLSAIIFLCEFPKAKVVYVVLIPYRIDFFFRKLTTHFCRCFTNI